LGKLRVLPAAAVCRILQTNGFHVKRQSGSHIVFHKTVAGHTHVVVVPNHRPIKIGTLGSIIRQSHLPRELFEEQS
jgi:predicted RNA binding protein YcfA (HicA-like mRNA interferase family)